ncbi:dynein intermediate chain 3, ciliary-like [Plodia interpunctella]|uniref:dynein intermediate chain 3, ciliary-like n=1 Tax=Plodia interpunctella TaxID=58824 RepID=UPI0023684A11|nr:dynein intermediate chain 3, ciliary-like [Plodia interpunctella]
MSKNKPFGKCKYEYSKIRKTFGRQPMFQDAKPYILDSILPNKEHQKLYILRNPVHCEVQATKTQSENEVNTPQVLVHEEGVNHVEGGWPRDVHLYNEEHVLRHRRRVMHDDNYINSVLKLAPDMTHYVYQNNAIDMYQTYFDKMQPQEAIEKYSIRTTNTFRDIHKRQISCIQWTADRPSKLVVAYCDRNNTYLTDVTARHKSCYIWDITQQIEPISYLRPDSPCWQLACSHIDHEIVLGGLENGTVCMFDIREGPEAVSNSVIYTSHRGPITSIRYIHSRTNTEFFTGSTDGQCLWWDSRNLSVPTAQLPICVNLKPGQTPELGISEGVTCLDYNTGLPTRFLCGTEKGLIINANRMGKTHSEILTSYWQTHDGLVRAVSRSPCTLRMFLTCGDSSVRIWSEEIRTAPIIVTEPYRYEVTDATWTPLRFSSYMSVCAGGYFYFWDLLRKYKEPVATLQVSPHGLTKVVPHFDGDMVAVGDICGSLFLLNLSENMTIPGPRDKHLMSSTYERETRREHLIDARLREIHLKARQAEEAAKLAAEEEEESIKSIVDELQEAEDDYFKIVNEELRHMEVAPSASNISIH